jgi:hypothetical protein
VEGKEEEQRVLNDFINSYDNASRVQAELTAKATCIHDCCYIMLLPLLYCTMFSELRSKSIFSSISLAQFFFVFSLLHAQILFLFPHKLKFPSFLISFE